MWRYGLEAWLVALLPSVALLGAVLALLHVAGVDTDLLGSPPDIRPTWSDLFGAVVFAPVVESVLLAWLLELLSSLSARRWFIASTAALVWGALHGLISAVWFFGTVWSFFVFAQAYLTWRTVSFRHGLAAAAIPHALVNLSAFTWVALDAAG